MTISFPVAIAAGALSFASACVLPVLPAYLAVLLGSVIGNAHELEETTRLRLALPRIAAFALGFGVVFATFGMMTYTAGVVVARSLPTISRFGGLVLIGAGGWLLLARAPRARWADLLVTAAAGLVVAAGWTPCIGPTFGSILYFAGRPDTLLAGQLRLLAYGGGLALPFLLLGIVGTLLTVPRRPSERTVRVLRWAVGTLLVVMGIVMMSGSYALWTARLAALGPWLTLERF